MVRLAVVVVKYSLSVFVRARGECAHSVAFDDVRIGVFCSKIDLRDEKRVDTATGKVGILFDQCFDYCCRMLIILTPV